MHVAVSSVDFWTIVWAIVVGLFVFIFIAWVLGLVINSLAGNPVGKALNTMNITMPTNGRGPSNLR